MAIIVPKNFEVCDYAKELKRNKLNRFLSGLLEKNGYMKTNVADIMLESNLSDDYKNNSDYIDSFKLIDYDGSVLFLPSDIMPPIMLSSRLTNQVPSRTFCIKDCYSFVNKGVSRNIPQIGAMHYGVDNVATQAEAICIAQQLAKSLDLQDYTININDTRILSGIVKIYTRQDFNKRYIKELLKGQTHSEMDNACVTMLTSVANAVGKITDIKFIADKIENKESVNGLYNLVNISELLGEYECENNIVYHTGFLGNNDYEEGFVFNLIVDGQLILHGGRYVYNIDGETLFGIGIKFNYAAIGKALHNIDDHDGRNNAFDVVLGTASSNLSLMKVNKLKNSFMDSNLKVNVLYNKSMEQVNEYAKKYGIESVIFVDNYGKMEYI